MTGDLVARTGLGRTWPRRAAYGAAYGAAGLAVLLPTSTASAGWFLAGRLLSVDGARLYPVKVRSVRGDRVALTRTADLDRPIPLGFTWPAGRARLTDTVVDRSRTTVVREVAEITRGELRPGLRAYSDGYVFEGDPASARGLAYTDISLRGDLGELPAWLVAPTAPARDTWVIAIHGRAAPRGEALRILPTLAGAGLPTLVVSYRNDTDAEPSPDRYFHLGDTEWHDIEPAIRYALANGARDVILYGWSMGGAIALNLLHRSHLATAVRGVVLDCPVIDWVATLRMHARALNLPAAWVWTTMRLVERRIGAHLTDLDQRRYAASLPVPVLAFVDHSDATVAAPPTVEFAAVRPDLVTLVETSDGGHCRSWNLDPGRYEAALTDWLSTVV